MTTQTSWNSPVPVPVDKGGTGASSMTAYAPVCGGTTSSAPLQEASSGQSNVGYVLTSTGSGSLPTWQAASGGGITTIDGDTSFVSAPTVALIASPTTGSTAKFVGNGVAQIALHASDVNSNTAWGQSSVPGGVNNTGVGTFACSSTSGSSTDNVAIGVRTANFSGAGSYNTCIGSFALDTNLLGPAVAPSYNVCIGYSAGSYYNANESSNILINNLGDNSGTESNTLKIGAGTGTSPLQLTKAYICGINGSTISSPAMVTIDTTTNQLSTTTLTALTSWTPVVSGSTSAGTGTYTLQSGYYSRIANMVFVQATITWTAHTGTGDMLISIPVATNSSSNYDPEGIINCINIPMPGGTSRTVLGSADPGTTSVNCYVTTTSGGNTPVALNASGTVHMTYVYST